MILSYLRTILLYLLLIIVIRLMGKRQIGQMEPTELVVAMLVADLAAIPMQDDAIPLYSGMVPILTILALELLFSVLSMRSVKLRRLLTGKPVILIDNGKVLQQNLRRTRVTLDELTEYLRENNVMDIQTVQYAILETSGSLSVFLYPKYMPANASDAGIKAKPQYLPVSIIEDGYLFTENLSYAGKDLTWVRKILQERGSTIRDTWLLTVDKEDHVVWLQKEGGRK